MAQKSELVVLVDGSPASIAVVDALKQRHANFTIIFSSSSAMELPAIRTACGTISGIANISRYFLGSIIEVQGQAKVGA